MALTVTMPQLGESVTEGTIARWLKHPGDAIAKYESIAEVITDKVNAEIPAPADGVMSELIAPEGAVVPVGQPICSIDTGADATDGAAPALLAEQSGSSARATSPAMSPPQTSQTAPEIAQLPTEQPAPQPVAQSGAQPAAQAGSSAPATPPAMSPAQTSQPAPENAQFSNAEAEAAAPIQAAFAEGATGSPAVPASAEPAGGNGAAGYHLTPAVRMLVREHGVDLAQISGSGIGGRVTKKDVRHRGAGGGGQGVPHRRPIRTGPQARRRARGRRRHGARRPGHPRPARRAAGALAAQAGAGRDHPRQHRAQPGRGGGADRRDGRVGFRKFLPAARFGRQGLGRARRCYSRKSPWQGRPTARVSE